MFGKGMGLDNSLEICPQRFNPRVRGTCLVSVVYVTALINGTTKFQSPCAGNMFSKG